MASLNAPPLLIRRRGGLTYLMHELGALGEVAGRPVGRVVRSDAFRLHDLWCAKVPSKACLFSLLYVGVRAILSAHTVLTLLRTYGAFFSASKR